ncbi:MAG: hypothetical protein DMF56_18830 [Acidobacteria bacterium]|nr:MAG: hypothetical protein DMF56_18830 [Acidobacteriota bacterium]
MRDPKESARLTAENETLAFECQVLTSTNRALTAKLAIVTAERDRLKQSLAAIEGSRAWRIVQKLRGLVGRRW